MTDIRAILVSQVDHTTYLNTAAEYRHKHNFVIQEESTGTNEDVICTRLSSV